MAYPQSITSSLEVNTGAPGQTERSTTASKDDFKTLSQGRMDEYQRDTDMPLTARLWQPGRNDDDKRRAAVTTSTSTSTKQQT